MSSSERQTDQWISIHWPVDGDIYSAEADALLCEAILPAADRLIDMRVGHAHFFVRYYDQTGPHIRFRLRLTPDGSAETSAILPFLIEWEHKRGFTPSLACVQYNPERERYGGAACIRMAEDYFCVSTQFVRLHLENADRALRGRRREFALQAMLGFALACTDSTGEAANLLRQYVTSFGHPLSRKLADSAGPQTPGGQGISELTRQHIASLLQGRRETSEFESHSRRYAHEVASRQVLRASEANVSPTRSTLAGILCSQLHMTSNRIGITRNEEVLLGSIAASALTE